MWVVISAHENETNGMDITSLARLSLNFLRKTYTHFGSFMFIHSKNFFLR
jgi:hypothetical protein